MLNDVYSLMYLTKEKIMENEAHAKRENLISQIKGRRVSISCVICEKIARMLLRRVENMRSKVDSVGEIRFSLGNYDEKMYETLIDDRRMEGYMLFSDIHRKTSMEELMV